MSAGRAAFHESEVPFTDNNLMNENLGETKTFAVPEQSPDVQKARITRDNSQALRSGSGGDVHDPAFLSGGNGDGGEDARRPADPEPVKRSDPSVRQKPANRPPVNRPPVNRPDKRADRDAEADKPVRISRDEPDEDEDFLFVYL